MFLSKEIFSQKYYDDDSGEFVVVVISYFEDTSLLMVSSLKKLGVSLWLLENNLENLSEFIVEHDDIFSRKDKIYSIVLETEKINIQ